MKQVRGRNKTVLLMRICKFLGVSNRIGWKGIIRLLNEASQNKFVNGTGTKYQKCLKAYEYLVRIDFDVSTLKIGPYLRTKGKKEKLNEQASQFYQSLKWKQARYVTLKRYNRECMCCGATEGPMHVDHIKPLKKYWHLRLDLENLQVLCSECNHAKGNWDETDFRPKAVSEHFFVDDNELVLWED
jgi:5-methylcytosine-specific restriction endonuclease McrA